MTHALPLVAVMTCPTDETDVSGRARSGHRGTALEPGTVVGPWRVEGELGRGGMGAVYAVVHEAIGKRAAMKVIHQHMFTPAYTAERFLLEARAVNVVTHPNIVDIFESGTLDDGRPYLIMERLRGKTLGERLDDGRIPPLEVIDYLLPLCDALAAAHAAGVVHRDIKLDNVFLVDSQATIALGSGGHGPLVKLLDWGIASVASVDAGRSFRDMLVGTPRYVAPEQARGEPATPASDVYSLGIVAYELFLESPPFIADSAAEVLAMHLTEAPPPPRDVWPQIPDALERLLLAMLVKPARQRPTIVQVAEGLRAARAELSRRTRSSDQVAAIAGAVEAPADPRATLERGPTLLPSESRRLRTVAVRRGRPWLVAIAACALVAMGAGARLGMARTSPAQPPAPATAAAAATTAAMAPPAPAPVTTAAPPGGAAAEPVHPRPRPRREQVRDAAPSSTSPRREPARSRARVSRDGGGPGRSSPRARGRRLHPDATIDPY